jgi:hypothetical protein
MLGVKFLVSKNEDGSFTAKVDKQDIEAKGISEAQAVIQAQKVLQKRIAELGPAALKRKDLN